ncbi:MAG: outer membrane beta-barrel family protein [Ferruginibacter sp.]
MKHLITLLVATSLCSYGFAQTPGQISGSIKDGGNQKVIDAATISLLKSNDSSLVKSAITDKEGGFLFENVKEGNYLVSASSLGHNKVYSKEFSISAEKNSYEVGVLKLEPTAESLKEVVVATKKPFIERRPDRMIVNVEASVSNTGSTALEVLEKSPGITIDKDGNISLKGKQGVKVFIDGKPSYLSGTDLANYLKSMSSAQMDQIEIMTNPPAKYDAAGNAGVINIKTKKNKTVGFNGSASATYTQGKYARFNESFNLNYRNKNVNVFGNLSRRDDKNYSELNILRRFRDKDSKQLLSIFDQEAVFTNKNQSNSGKLGIDVNVSKKTTVGAVVSGFINDELFNNDNNTQLQNSLGVTDSSTHATTQVDGQWKNFSTNFNARHVFDSTGRELSFDADYIRYSQANQQGLYNHYFDALGHKSSPSDTLLSNIPSSIKIYSFKADYSQPLKGGVKLEAGVKASFVKTDNDARYDYVVNGQKVHDQSRSNHFIYDEQIKAAYVNVNKQLGKKWSTQAGLRLENTISKGNQVTTGEKFERNYTQLFPTAYVSYEMNAKNSFSVNYGRRIERPDYADLNPFYFFLDKYTYQRGNINLRPQFSHNIELSHTYAGNFTTTLNYTKTTDLMNDVLDQNEESKETFITKSNIASQRQFGVTVTTMVPVQKWLSINVYANFSNNRFKGFINNSNVDLQSNLFTANVNAQMNLGKGWNGELSGFFRSKGLDGVLVIGNLGALNGGISKSILKNKGTVKLGFRDILWTQKFKGSAEYAYIDTHFRQQRDSRQVSLSFNWRFGNAKIAAPKRKAGGASEEQNRVKTGGN